MGTLFQQVRDALRRFVRNESGLASAEMIIVMPVYLFCILGTFTFWDAFDVANRQQKAAYSVSDLVTRKQDQVTEAYVGGLFDTMQYMMGPALPVRTRITSLFYNGTDDRYQVIWSRSSYTGVPPLTTDTLSTIQSHLPLMFDGDALVVVETRVEFTPILGAVTLALDALDSGTMENVIVTRPRFLPKVCMEGVACG